jgi:endonuclease/exonuclease/phosphatase family metal-dependent hydrolase
MNSLLLILALSVPHGLPVRAQITSSPSPGEDVQVRVMSFNIRYGTASDGDNHWDRRREFLLETIRTFNPDLLGTQETLKFQRDWLAEKLPDYEVLGVGRNDGKDDGEMMALYFRRDRFECLDSGHFWLSETPDVIGSQSWDSALPRMVTWVRLRDRQQPDTAPVLFLNTHFDHKGPKARLESARLLRQRVESLRDGAAVVVSGDFNAGADSDPYRALFGEPDGAASPLVDSYRVAHPSVATDEGTFSGFKASETKGARIDWIGVSRDWTVVNAAIDRTARDGRTPSDHCPVTAILGLREQAAALR